jgi:hypothetical protein
MGTDRPVRKLLGLLALSLIASLTVAVSPVLANGEHGNGDGRGHHDRAVKCNGTFTGVTVRDDVVVPPYGACTLKNSTVKGDVEVSKKAYFQSTNTTIWEDVEASEAQTVFVDTGSKVGGDVVSSKTAQVFVFNSTVQGGIGVAYTTDTVNVCGNTVNGAGIGVVRSGRDILVGDPLTVGCGGNSVTHGSVLIAQNNTDVELVFRGNSIPNGSAYVLDNVGPSGKFVENNTGGNKLRCTGNQAPFSGSPNPGWQQYEGQCSA